MIRALDDAKRNKKLIDEDKTLNHYQIQLQVQLFERN